MILSPFAPLLPWLLSAVMFDTPMCIRPNGRARLVSIQRSRADGPTQYRFAEHRPTWTNETPDLDLRHGPTRYAILRALADAGHSRPWALGAPWSLLTDEQAGRATAEIVRAVGEDPRKPARVVPVCVLGAWKPCYARVFSQSTGRMEDERPHLVGARIPHGIGERGWLAGAQDGPETGEPGRIAADNAARALGCLMIEDLTP